MAEAARWVAKAAALGLSDSQFISAVLYERRRRRVAKPARRLKWYSTRRFGRCRIQSRIGVLQTQLGDATGDSRQVRRYVSTPRRWITRRMCRRIASKPGS